MLMLCLLCLLHFVCVDLSNHLSTNAFCISSHYYHIVWAHLFLSADLPTRGTVSTAPEPMSWQVSVCYLCHYKIARHHTIPTIMATTKPRIPMIMSKSAPFVPAIFFSTIVVLFKVHFLLDQLRPFQYRAFCVSYVALTNPERSWW